MFSTDIKILCFVLKFRSDKTESLTASKDTTIKPAKLSRGRAPKPLVQLGRKRGKNPPSPSTKTKDSASDKGEESVNDGAAEEQVVMILFSK